jgi:hypothetical protein
MLNKFTFRDQNAQASFMKRFPGLPPLIILISLMAIFTTCAKEYSNEGGPGSGYVFVGSPGSCTNPVIAGNYYMGHTLNASNTVRLLVDVTSPGNYYIVTNMADGFSFSASGKFSDTGRQEIILTGNGVPDTTGIFTIQIPGTTGCYFTINVEEIPKAVFTLAGEPNDCTNPVIKGSYFQNVGPSGSNKVIVNVVVTTTGAYHIATDTLNGISFSASGTFDTTGDQQVVLQASGDMGDVGFLTFNVSAGASNCAFSIPVTNNPSFGTYVLESNSGQHAYCAYAPFSNSSLRAGSPLNPQSDYFDLEVYVTDVGNWSVGTRSVNGMTFYGAGKFTTLGEQMIRLGGHGTPQAAGRFRLTPEILGPSPIGGEYCSLNVEVQ